MQVINYSTLRNKLKEYCDKVFDENEEIVVTRKKERHVVLISIERYNQLKKKESGNS